MRVAIYARYSTDMQREASIEDQVHDCKERIKREGWSLAGIYADAAISGTIEDRPEYQKMLEHATEGKFEIVLAEGLDRLSRDQEYTARLYKHLVFHDVKLITLSEDIISELHVGLKGTMNALYIKDLAIKVRRGMEGRVRDGFCGGGKLYGYDVIKELDSKGELVRGKREVNPEQAAIIRQIFAWYSEGNGYADIAGKLNRENIPSPRGKKWVGSAIRPLLMNETFRGLMILNRTTWRKNPTTGKARVIRHPREKWVITPTPELRIIDEELWTKVQAKFAGRAHKLRELNRKGKTRFGKQPRYLFSGIVKCDCCDGPYIKKDGVRYGCANYVRSKGTLCKNNKTVLKDVMEKKLLYAIKMDLFDDASFEKLKVEVRRVLVERMKSRNKDAGKLKRDLAKIEREIKSMINFIKAGTITPTLSDELRKAEATKKQLVEQLDADLPQIENIDEIFKDAIERYAVALKNFETYAARDINKAREMIRMLVGGEIRLVPTEGGGLIAKLKGHPAGVIHLVRADPGTKGRSRKLVQHAAMVAEEGLEPPTRGL